MKSILRLASTLILIFLATSLQAEQVHLDTRQPYSISAGLGKAKHTFKAERGSIDDKKYNYTLAASYQLTPIFSITAEHTDYGKADIFRMYFNTSANNRVYASIQAKTTGTSLYGTFHTEKQLHAWSYGASIGFTRWKTKLLVDTDLAEVSKITLANESDGSIFTRLNATYHLNRQFDVSLISSFTFMQDVETNNDNLTLENIDMRFLNVGFVATYHF